MAKPRLVSMLESQLPKARRSRVIDIEGAITPEVASKFCHEMSLLIEEDLIINEFNNQMTQVEGGEAYMIPYDTIRINLSTPGGYVLYGCAMLDIMDECIAPIHIHVRGLCMSMGIPLLCKAGKRTAGKHASFMLHGSGMHTGGYTEEIKSTIEYQEKQDNLLNQIILEATNITPEQLDKSATKMWYLDYAEALEVGLLTHDLYDTGKSAIKEVDEIDDEEELSGEQVIEAVLNSLDENLTKIQKVVDKDALCREDALSIETMITDLAHMVKESLPLPIDKVVEIAAKMESILDYVSVYMEEAYDEVIAPKVYKRIEDMVKVAAEFEVEEQEED